MKDAILTVRELTDQLRSVVKGRFPFVWVRGEVTNLSRPGSGHMYFSLKDKDAQLQCVWFRGDQRQQEKFDPLTGEVFAGAPRPSLAKSLSNGQQVCCAGDIDVYAQRGSYQLIVKIAQDVGRGHLAVLFEKLKQDLRERGFFDQDHKRALPNSPTRVAVVTAPSGAALQDFIRLATQRGSGAEIRIYPALMQGDNAPADIIRALKQAQRDGWAQVIVLIRGGGSLEDLWAFNDEALAKAIFNASLPILAGIGHEVDFTLADLTADVRAATPSHAAQLLWQEKADMYATLASLEERLQLALKMRLQQCEQNLRHADTLLDMCSPLRRLTRNTECVERLTQALYAASKAYIYQQQINMDAATDALRLCSPAPRLALHAEKCTRLAKSLQASFAHWLTVAEHCWQDTNLALQHAVEARLTESTAQLDAMVLRLEKHAPDAPMRRGFALLHDAKGRAITSACMVQAGDALHVTMHDGSFIVTVQKVQT